MTGQASGRWSIAIGYGPLRELLSELSTPDAETRRCRREGDGRRPRKAPSVSTRNCVWERCSFLNSTRLRWGGCSLGRLAPHSYVLQSSSRHLNRTFLAIPHGQRPFEQVSVPALIAAQPCRRDGAKRRFALKSRLTRCAVWVQGADRPVGIPPLQGSPTPGYRYRDEGRTRRRRSHHCMRELHGVGEDVWRSGQENGNCIAPRFEERKAMGWRIIPVDAASRSTKRTKDRDKKSASSAEFRRLHAGSCRLLDPSNVSALRSATAFISQNQSRRTTRRSLPSMPRSTKILDQPRTW